MTEPAIQDALSAADVFFADDKKYWEYLKRQAAILDYNSGIESAREEEKISVAKNLSVEKIQALAK